MLACEQAPSEVWKKNSASEERDSVSEASGMASLAEFFSDLAGSLGACSQARVMYEYGLEDCLFKRSLTDLLSL